MSHHVDKQSVRAAITKLFEFLKAFTDLRHPPVRDIDMQLRSLWLSELPTHSSVELFQNTNTTEESTDADVILRLTRASTTNCPRPPLGLADWLKSGWHELPGCVHVRETRNSLDAQGNTVIERFDADPRRPSLLFGWEQQRNLWIANERPARQSLALFQRIYEWYGIHEREGEKIEFMLGDGLLTCCDPTGNFRHPVLLQKLQIEFSPEKRKPQFVFRKAEQPPQLYMEFLRNLPGANAQQLARCADELKSGEFSPLGGDDTEGFLRRLIQGLFPSAGQVVHPEERHETTPHHEIEGPTVRRKPVIFMRARMTGPSNVFELVLEDIASRDAFPPALLRILGIETAVTTSGDRSRGGHLGNEDRDVLLSKPANRDQLEIARQLTEKDCVLVQGPPGTGIAIRPCPLGWI